MYYSPVFDMLTQHHPEYVALAWGSVKFVLMVSFVSLLAAHFRAYVAGGASTADADWCSSIQLGLIRRVFDVLFFMWGILLTPIYRASSITRISYPNSPRLSLKSVKLYGRQIWAPSYIKSSTWKKPFPDFTRISYYSSSKRWSGIAWVQREERSRQSSNHSSSITKILLRRSNFVHRLSIISRVLPIALSFETSMIPSRNNTSKTVREIRSFRKCKRSWMAFKRGWRVQLFKYCRPEQVSTAHSSCAIC